MRIFAVFACRLSSLTEAIAYVSAYQYSMTDGFFVPLVSSLNVNTTMDDSGDWFYAGDTREEKVFRMWINSLAIDNGDLYINNLFADVQNGCAILKVSAFPVWVWPLMWCL